MYGIVVVAHGTFGQHIVETAELILGSIEDLKYIAINKINSKDELLTQIVSTIRRMSNKNKQPILVLTDMFGGTPGNLVSEAMFLLKDEVNIKTLCGVNLPMVLEAASKRSEATLEVAVEKVRQIGLENIIEITYEDN